MRMKRSSFLFTTAIFTVALPQGARALSKSILSGPTKCSDALKVQKGSLVRLHYTGTIAEQSISGVPGTIFDSSYDHGNNGSNGNGDSEPKPFETQIGVGKLIKGWDIGILGLCLGTKARLIIPPSQGYGERGFLPAIPPGATLQFDVEIVDVAQYRQIEVEVPAADDSGNVNNGGYNVFAAIDTNKDDKLSLDELRAFFAQQGSDVPPEVWNDDMDNDGYISWEEFSGPKGDGPPGMEEMKKKMEEQDRLRGSGNNSNNEEQKKKKDIPEEELTAAAAAARRKLRAKKEKGRNNNKQQQQQQQQQTVASAVEQAQ